MVAVTTLAQCICIISVFFIKLSKGFNNRNDEVDEACKAMEMIEYTLVKSECDLEIDVKKVNPARKLICKRISKCDPATADDTEIRNILEYFDEKIKQHPEDSPSSHVTDFLVNNFYLNFLPVVLSMFIIIVRSIRHNCLRIFVVLLLFVCVSAIFTFSISEFSCKEDKEMIWQLYYNSVKPIMIKQLQLSNTTYQQQKTNLIQNEYPANWFLANLSFLFNMLIDHFYVKVDKK